MHAFLIAATLGVAFGLLTDGAGADAVSYRQPPQAIADVSHAPPLPVVMLSPTRDTLAIVTPVRSQTVAELARPMLRLAGLRIDPTTNGIHDALAYTSLALERVSDGTTQHVTLPSNARITALLFSPNGTQFAVAAASASGTDLYIGSTMLATIVHVPGIKLNGIFGAPLTWMPDGRHLLVHALARHGPAPREPFAPTGPIVQETSREKGQVGTYEDLLASPHDADIFDYYATSQLELVDTTSFVHTNVGVPGIVTTVQPSPSGDDLLVTRILRPYSYLFPYKRFPTQIAVLTKTGIPAAIIAARPLLVTIPIDGVESGPRLVAWKPNAPATLAWVEALDGGDPRTVAPLRDRVMLREIATKIAPYEIDRTVARTTSLTWLANDDRAILREYDRTTRYTRTWLLDGVGGVSKSIGIPLRDGDHYHDPGQPLTATTPSGEQAIVHVGNVVYLRGEGFGSGGRRPFLDRLDLATMTTTRVFRSALDPLDTVIALGDNDASTLFIQRQSWALPPNVFVHGPAGDRALTAFADPTPQFQAVQRRVVSYKRADGVSLSFTLYLPPGYKKGTRLPTLLWASPAEFHDASVASQNANSVQTFQTVGAASQVYMALAGYAVLDNASIPILGDSLTANDTYVPQILAGAKAAIDEAVAIGVTDPNRVAIGGQNDGAFMTMNLLAHSHLFRAGIARSGADNRTLTPFNFQPERRTSLEATDLSTKMSPFSDADKITDPVLLIHGIKDDNANTFPIQSERTFATIEGNGGVARLVMLPDDAHGRDQATNATVLAEMVDWLDRWVKNASPRPNETR